MELEDHGGSCCGVKHIFNFDSGTEQELDVLIQEVENGNIENNRLIEVILSERQVNPNDYRHRRDETPARGWPAILRERGFTLVNAFRNSNSGRNCYVFHLINRPLPFATDADLSFSWHSLPSEPIVPPVTEDPVAERSPLFNVGDVVRNTRVIGRPAGVVTRRITTFGGFNYHVTVEGVNRVWQETNLERVEDALPLPVVEMPPAPVTPTAPRIVRTYYQNVFSDGSLGRSRLASPVSAREWRRVNLSGVYPMRRIDIYNNGAEVITEFNYEG